MKKILAALLVLILALGITACGTQQAAPAASTAPAEDAPAEEAATEEAAEPVVVRIGATGTFYNAIWDVVQEAVADDGIKLEVVQFNNYSIPNNALNSGELEMNAFQHHAYFNNDTTSNGYNLTPIGDTFILTMNIFSDKIDDISELKDGDIVAVPNDVTNEGRALKLLESAGVLELDPAAGNSPAITDITNYNVKVELNEVDANLVPTLLPDVTIAVVNGNYALDAGLKAEDALFNETEYADNSYVNLIAVRSEDADNPIYQKIVEAYQSDAVIELFNTQYAGFLSPAWNLNLPDAA